MSVVSAITFDVCRIAFHSWSVPKAGAKADVDNKSLQYNAYAIILIDLVIYLLVNNLLTYLLCMDLFLHTIFKKL